MCILNDLVNEVPYTFLTTLIKCEKCIRNNFYSLDCGSRILSVSVKLL